VIGWTEGHRHPRFSLVRGRHDGWSIFVKWSKRLDNYSSTAEDISLLKRINQVLKYADCDQSMDIRRGRFSVERGGGLKCPCRVDGPCNKPLTEACYDSRSEFERKRDPICNRIEPCSRFLSSRPSRTVTSKVLASVAAHGWRIGALSQPLK
jgi:hypothetical protein